MTDIQWTTEQRRIGDLIPFEGNSRKMNQKQAQDLMDSITKFNIAEIQAIDTDNTIIAGHKRIEALKLLGRGGEEIDVRVPNRKLTDDERREYLIRSTGTRANGTGICSPTSTRRSYSSGASPRKSLTSILTCIPRARRMTRFLKWWSHLQRQVISISLASTASCAAIQPDTRIWTAK